MSLFIRDDIPVRQLDAEYKLKMRQLAKLFAYRVYGHLNYRKVEGKVHLNWKNLEYRQVLTKLLLKGA